ncbi:hypothetical protein JKP88DRAFT_240798 [Tribonema minus]|uniref:Uncharacterized protein n=1 Tax=Tribonema minus TaxID=303371 RepID=A0A836CPU1_9STRA|nr:hypothetical protein JKP88DRAFT_240798 [Tribonema minus]
MGAAFFGSNEENEMMRKVREFAANPGVCGPGGLLKPMDAEARKAWDERAVLDNIRMLIRHQFMTAPLLLANEAFHETFRRELQHTAACRMRQEVYGRLYAHPSGWVDVSPKPDILNVSRPRRAQGVLKATTDPEAREVFEERTRFHNIRMLLQHKLKTGPLLLANEAFHETFRMSGFGDTSTQPLGWA